MVNEGIVLGHKISERGIEVDKAKVDSIEKMPCPRDIKDFLQVSFSLNGKDLMLSKRSIGLERLK
jgi:hypothetical protein